MRRSKEKGFITPGRRWKCTGECRECICCLVKSEDGNWEHVDLRRQKKGV